MGLVVCCEQNRSESQRSIKVIREKSFKHRGRGRYPRQASCPQSAFRCLDLAISQSSLRPETSKENPRPHCSFKIRLGSVPCVSITATTQRPKQSTITGNQKGTFDQFGIPDHTPVGRSGAALYEGARVFKYAGRTLSVIGAVTDLVSIAIASNPLRRSTQSSQLGRLHGRVQKALASSALQ
jgi:hypothetical protein